MSTKQKQEKPTQIERKVFVIFKIEAIILLISAVWYVLTFNNLASVLSFMILYALVPLVAAICLLSLATVSNLDSTTTRFRLIALVNWLTLIAMIFNVAS